MKKLKYESVNEIRRSGIFTKSQFRSSERRMEGVVACNGGDETKFITVVMFRDRKTGNFPWEHLFEGGKKVVFRGRMNTRRNPNTGKTYDEVILEEMHENVPVEVDVPDDEDVREPARGRHDGGYRRGGEGGRGQERPSFQRRRPYNPDFSRAAGMEPVPDGLFDDDEDDGGGGEI